MSPKPAAPAHDHRAVMVSVPSPRFSMPKTKAPPDSGPAYTSVPGGVVVMPTNDSGDGERGDGSGIESGKGRAYTSRFRTERERHVPPVASEDGSVPYALTEATVAKQNSSTAG